MIYVNAVSNSYDYSVSMVSGGRYEIVQSYNHFLYTFKLDKRTGKVWRHRHRYEEGAGLPIWVETRRQNEVADSKYVEGDNFQLFIGELGIYLLDVNNGTTWRFYDHDRYKLDIDMWIEESNVK